MEPECAIELLASRGRRMSESDYDRERTALRKTNGESSAAAIAKREQALAALLHRSGWTQEEVAEKEGISQQRIEEKLRFGRFLEFTGSTSNFRSPALQKLSESKFNGKNGYWRQTQKGGERDRFTEIAQLIGDNTSLRQKNRPKIGRELLDRFADGKWHGLAAMASHLETAEDHVSSTLVTMRKLGKANVESKPVGKSRSYRIFKNTRMISSDELATKLGPIIEGLLAEGTKNMATMSPTAVATLATQLKRLLDEWAR